jgi:hypothetical protein
MYRLLQIVSVINVVLAIVMIVIQSSEGAATLEITRSVFYGFGFVGMFASATREMRAPDTGRAWMVVGGAALLVASILFFVAR